MITKILIETDQYANVYKVDLDYSDSKAVDFLLSKLRGSIQRAGLKNLGLDSPGE